MMIIMIVTNYLSLYTKVYIPKKNILNEDNDVDDDGSGGSCFFELHVKVKGIKNLKMKKR